MPLRPSAAGNVPDVVRLRRRRGRGLLPRLRRRRPRPVRRHPPQGCRSPSVRTSAEMSLWQTRPRSDQEPSAVHGSKSKPVRQWRGEYVVVRLALFARSIDNPTTAAGGQDPGPARHLGVCIYDTQHILVGDRSSSKNIPGLTWTQGFPKFLSVVGDSCPRVRLIRATPCTCPIEPRLKRISRTSGPRQDPPPNRVRAAICRRDWSRPRGSSRSATGRRGLDPVLPTARYIGRGPELIHPQDVN